MTYLKLALAVACVVAGTYLVFVGPVSGWVLLGLGLAEIGWWLVTRVFRSPEE